jgi:hypothetical protein
MKAPRILSYLALAATLCSSASGLDLPGVWNATASTEEGERSITWTYAKDGDGYTGTSRDNESGDVTDLDRVLVDGEKLTVEVDFERDGSKGMIKVVAEQDKPGHLAGKWSMVGADGTVYAEGKVVADKEAKPSFAGAWKSVAKVPDNDDAEATLTIEDGESGMTAAFEDDLGNILKIEKVKADGENLRMEFEMGTDIVIKVVIEGKLDGADKIVGKWVLPEGEGASGAWQATRLAPDYADDWDVTAALPDGGEYTGVLTLAKDGDAYSGNSKSSTGEEATLASVTVSDEGAVNYTVSMERDGFSGKIIVNAKPDSDGALVGGWKLQSDTGEAVAEGAWKAVRKE